MDKSLIQTQMAILVQIVRYIHIKQVLTELDPNPELNFWRLIHGAFLDAPVLDWCKIFGSDAEPTHWKGVVDDKDSFRADLLRVLNITQSEWTSYWNHLHDYRNEFVSHSVEEAAVTKYPSLDLALQSCHFYYDYLLNRLQDGDVDEVERLGAYSKRFSEHTAQIAQAALDATKEFREWEE